MSTPISHGQFVKALKELPYIGLIHHTCEIRNSIKHLQSSNDQLAEFAADDADCRDAIKENEVVLTRFRDRLQLVQDELSTRPNGVILPDDDEKLTDLLKAEVSKDVDREIESFEKAMKAKYGDEWTGGSEGQNDQEGQEGCVSGMDETVGTEASLPARSTTSVEPIPGSHPDAESTTTHEQLSSDILTLRPSIDAEAPRERHESHSGRYTDEQLSSLLSDRMKEMGVDDGSAKGGIFL